MRLTLCIISSTVRLYEHSPGEPTWERRRRLSSQWPTLKDVLDAQVRPVVACRVVGPVLLRHRRVVVHFDGALL